MTKNSILANAKRYGIWWVTAWLLSFTIVCPTEASTPPQVVEIIRMAFSPGDMTVRLGTRVTWINRDQIPHTVTSRDKGGVLSSQGLDTGDSYSYTFTRPGDYAYFCAVHPFMKGVVHVRK
ncbi:cupredoxin family copper-binding protein [Rhodanobacter ginsengisoli]|uniref:Cupredoxin family copper-binding protein n=1 Tax=Rhodanobacter ginsengisoli TaxID=418646 RepID=A0ABW0QPW1_9GAMM